MKKYQIKVINTADGESYNEMFEAEDKYKAKQLAKLEFCNPPGSHMCNVKIISCKLIK